MNLKDKNKTPNGGFTFFFHAPNSKVEQVSGANSVSQLTEKVKNRFSNLGMEVPDNISVIIEHQICVRQEHPALVCWNDGVGDVIHNKFAVPFLKAGARAAEKVGLSKVSRGLTRISGCSSCGGTRIYKQGADNLGRAGKLNKAFG